MSTEQRIPALDVAKGVAILFVLCIHAELLSASLFHTHAIGRAVPMFLVLFGMTSTMWWDSRGASATLGTWYRSRLGRLLPAYWLAVLAWWSGQRVLSDRYLGMHALAYSLAGYAPWIQTSWFVTAILQLVVIFPLLRLAVLRLGGAFAVISGFVLMVVSQAYALPLNDWLRGHLPYDDRALGFYAFWLFVPQYLWLVLFGMSYTRLAAAVRWPWATAAFAATAAGVIAASVLPEPSTISRVAMAAVDPARTVILLAAAAAIARAATVSSALAWLGRNSWEIYLGQMVIHSLGYPAWCRWGGPSEHRIEYTLLLLIGGVGFSLVYTELRHRLNAHEAPA